MKQNFKKYHVWPQKYLLFSDEKYITINLNVININVSFLNIY